MKINESKKTEHNYILLFIGLGFYIFVLFAFLFFKTNSFQSLNLIPFYTITDYLSNGGIISIINVLGNIVLFIPTFPNFCSCSETWRSCFYPARRIVVTTMSV